MRTYQRAKVWTDTVRRFEPGCFRRRLLVCFRDAGAFRKMFLGEAALVETATAAKTINSKKKRMCVVIVYLF